MTLTVASVECALKIHEILLIYWSTAKRLAVKAKHRGNLGISVNNNQWKPSLVTLVYLIVPNECSIVGMMQELTDKNLYFGFHANKKLKTHEKDNLTFWWKSIKHILVPGGDPSQPAIRTGYTCEGDEMVVQCGSEETIQIVRANYGRFSIAICNDDGKTHWSVNCMSPKTRHILQNKWV